jgi:hypothetical protein
VGGVSESIHRNEGVSVGKCEMLDDWRKVWALLDGDILKATGRHHNLAPFIEQTREMLALHWPAVEAFSHRLIELGRVEGEQVQAIIDRAMRMAA